MTAAQEIATAPAAVDYTAIVSAWPPEERARREKKFLRKVDFRLLPILVSPAERRSTLVRKGLTVRSIIMYLLNYVDRNALPQARVQGLEDDLGLKGVEYNVVLSITFIGYIVMQGEFLFRPYHDGATIIILPSP